MGLKDEVKDELDKLNDKNDIITCRLNKESDMREHGQGIYHNDYCRILYSSFFRRLQGKMQLLGVNANKFYRNRLTHSLEVAQIAESIASRCGYNIENMFVVKAGALAHDLGNPPFGHYGEKVLNDVFRSYGGFEGNAQTLRILTVLEQKKPGFKGLNLTLRTLLSVVKYFKKYEFGMNEKFIYDKDYDLINSALKKSNNKCRTLDVQIVDLADEIAYAAHDLEDALGNNVFTIEELLNEMSNRDKEYSDFKKMVDEVERGLRKNCKGGLEYRTLFKKELLSYMTNAFINDISYRDIDENFKKKTGTKKDKELTLSNYKNLVRSLKEVIFKCATYGEEIYLYEKKGEKVIKFLSNFYRENVKALPEDYREEYYNEDNEFQHHLKERLICDYIAGMMDTFAISRYEMFSGEKFDKMDIGK